MLRSTGANEITQAAHELQAELGEDWVLRFSVQGDDAWLTAEKPGEDQRVEAPDAQGLLPIVDAINEGGGRRRSE